MDGFTIADGSFNVTGNGAGIYMTAGTVKNCIITNCFARGYGPGIYMTGGTVTNCTVVKCFTGNSHASQSGGGIYMSAGLVVDSDILENYARRAGCGVYMLGGELLRCWVRGNTYTIGSTWGYGAALWLDGDCRARNCLVTGNVGSTDASGGGGGVRLNHIDARLENCTVVGNDTLGSGGGIKLLAGAVTNCIVYYNMATNGGNDIYISGVTNIGHTCSPDLVHDPSGTGNITNAPQFTDAGGGYGLSHTNGDYHPLTTSPSVNAGVNQPWMSAGLDLDHEPRLLGKFVDMGAYETFVPPSGTVFMFR